MERWRIAHKESNFTIIDNGIFNDPDLTYEEVGLLCTILSLPISWEFSINGFSKIVKESEPTVRRIIRALIGHGYCKLDRIVDPKTKRVVKWEYTFYEVKNGLGCNSEPQVKIPDVEEPQSGVTTSGNLYPIKYYKEERTNKESTDKKKDIFISKEKFDFVSALVGIGVSREAAAEWLQVRKTKRATNTKIAFDRIAREIAKSGRSADECIRFSVEHSYSGFEAEWMPKAPQEKYEYFGDIEGYINARKNGLITR